MGKRMFLAVLQPAAIVSVLLVLGSYHPAKAFKRSRANETQACVWWADRVIPVYLNQRGSQDVLMSDLVKAVHDSLETWSTPGCSDFQFNYVDTTPEDQAGYDQSQPNNNINLVTFKEDGWPYPDSGEGPGSMVVALTTITFDTCTGQIFDADLEMNGTDNRFSTDGTGANAFDVQNTVTHEAGHMLGLDHSSILESTMYAYESANETDKRDLHIDDINGVCYVYPVDLTLPTCLGSSIPSHCKPVCGCQAYQQNSESWMLLVLVLLGLRIKQTRLRNG